MPVMLWVWLGLFVLFLVMEGVTAGLVSIWFAAGALVALLSAVLGAELWLQCVCFLVVSVVVLLLARPLARKYVGAKRRHTNADMVLDEVGTVTRELDNVRGGGYVKVGPREWLARTESGAIVPVGERVRPLRIEGATLIVEKLKEAEVKTGD